MKGYKIEFIGVYPQREDKSSLDIRIKINEQPYEIAIRNTIVRDKDGNETTQLTILKSPELWWVKHDVFGYPSD